MRLPWTNIPKGFENWEEAIFSPWVKSRLQQQAVYAFHQAVKNPTYASVQTLEREVEILENIEKGDGKRVLSSVRRAFQNFSGIVSEGDIKNAFEMRL